jgi:hypothetical protein
MPTISPKKTQILQSLADTVDILEDVRVTHEKGKLHDVNHRAIQRLEQYDGLQCKNEGSREIIPQHAPQSGWFGVDRSSKSLVGC